MTMRTHTIEKHIFIESEISLMNNTGVYKMWHERKPKLFYIGSTMYVRSKETWKSGFYTRWNQHISRLQSELSSVTGMKAIVKKYGIEGLRFQIIEICDREICREREMEYIKQLNPPLNRFKGTKKIYRFSLDGTLIQVHDSMDEAARTLGIDRGSINHCALGNRESAGGYAFSFTEKHNLPEVRKVLKMSMSGTLLEKFNSLEEVKESLNITSSTAIRNAIKGVQKQAYGFKWAYQMETGYTLKNTVQP